MMGLSDGRKSFPIGLAVLIQYRRVTATQPATQPPSHIAVAITLNAQASSLMMTSSAMVIIFLDVALYLEDEDEDDMLNWTADGQTM